MVEQQEYASEGRLIKSDSKNSVIRHHLGSFPPFEKTNEFMEAENSNGNRRCADGNGINSRAEKAGKGACEEV